MTQEELNAKITEFNGIMEKLSAAAKDAVETAQVYRLEAGEALGEKIDEARGNIVAMQENFRIASERLQGKAFSEMLKAQMSMRAAREDFEAELDAKKNEADKAGYEAYMQDVSEYARICAKISELATEESKLAALRLLDAQTKFKEKFGEAE
jgi:hypothetical protein